MPTYYAVASILTLNVSQLSTGKMANFVSFSLFPVIRVSTKAIDNQIAQPSFDARWIELHAPSIDHRQHIPEHISEN